MERLKFPIQSIMGLGTIQWETDSTVPSRVSREEVHRPVMVPRWGIGARDGDETGFLGIVAYGRGTVAGGILQRMGNPTGAVPLPDTFARGEPDGMLFHRHTAYQSVFYESK